MFARVAVGSLVLHEAGGYNIIPPLPGPQTGRYITKIRAGGNQGNRTMNRQVLAKFIESVSVARKPLSGRPSKRNGPCNGTDRGTEWNRPFYAVFRKKLSPCNANGTDRF